MKARARALKEAWREVAPYMGIIGLGLPVATVSGDAVLQLAFGVFAVVLGVLYWLAIEGRPAGNAKWFVGGGMGLGGLTVFLGLWTLLGSNRGWIVAAGPPIFPPAKAQRGASFTNPNDGAATV